MKADELYERSASEVLRAVRGRRSQRAFAQRLGYQANPITDWENGRRYPTATETLRALRLVRIDARAAFEHFAPFDLSSSQPLAEWMQQLQGSSTLAEIARRAGHSRYAIGRWINGQTHPRLPDFFRYVDATTNRLQEFVHLLVGIEAVPSLRARFDQVESARQLALEQPWTEAILRLLETKRGQRAKNPARFLARVLELPPAHVDSLLERLVEAKIVEMDCGSYRVLRSLTVDTGAPREDLNRVRRHWAQVGQQRMQVHPEGDWFAYNVIAVSKKDSERIEQRLRAAYREVRGIVSESQPEEVAALLTIHMVRW